MLKNIPIITIAGTNGKGSVVAFCESILLAAGYKVGAYYSPHVFHISERIKINNQPITIPNFTQPFSFERYTQKALELFSQQNLDAVLLEVGIGGRLDPVNLFAEPEVSVITNIDYDHQDKLGNSLEQIGFEKAHIFRSNKPSIIGCENIPQTVLDHAQTIKTNLFKYKINFNYKIHENHWEFKNVKYTLKNLPMTPLTIHNAAIALEALSHFSLTLSEENIRRGLISAHLPGRFKIINTPNHITQIFDVAHNPGSAQLLAEKLKKLSCEGKTIAVIGMLKDKDILGTLGPLLDLVDVWVAGTLNDPRAASCYEIGAYLPNSVLCPDIQQAYATALNQAKAGDRVVVFGSFRTVGALCPDQS